MDLPSLDDTIMIILMLTYINADIGDSKSGYTAVLEYIEYDR